ncbi:MAG: aminotransferase class I/II-fold pyridoxal phosphate-dependent enzyme [Opitutaceae bacterium]|nr:aminotransferase class I/II-fold pyridoxal phosphate-dependent enzyme [Opitutaceae bacterium]
MPSRPKPDIFAKFRALQDRHAQIKEGTGVDPLGMRIDRMDSPTQAWIDGRPVILMGSNNYLGLTFSPDALAAATEALRAFGTGTTGSRVANGSYACHQGIERQLADFYGCRRAVLFTTGYQANVGFISAIAGKDDILLIDSDSHASIYDGCKLSDATIYRFRHNDPQDLARRLERLPRHACKMIVVEGIYSMLGDYAPLRELVAVARRYGAYIMVDEAHSLGVLGETGRGLTQHLGLGEEVDFIIGTFSKSVGTIGGFCVSNHDALEAVRIAARAYLFTASLPPSVVASASITLERIRTDPSLRTRLWSNTDYLYQGLQALGLPIGPNKTPVIGITVPDTAKALRGWRTLLDAGVYVNLALPPATPSNAALLRCSLCAAHTREQLDTVLAAFARVRDQIG